MKRFLLLLLYVCPLFATTITGPLKTPNTATPFNGTIIITPSVQFTNSSGEIVTQTPVTVTVTAGSFSIDLEPTDLATNPSNPYYTFVFYPTGQASYTQRYRVATSATALTIADLDLLTAAAAPAYSYLYSTSTYTNPIWLSFLQSGTGAVARAVTDRLKETMSVKDFGAKGDGSTDDTVNVQKAVTQACLTGGRLYFPPGSYVISPPGIIGTVNACSNVEIYGAGDATIFPVAANTNFVSADTSKLPDGGLFQFIGGQNLYFHDFYVQGFADDPRWRLPDWAARYCRRFLDHGPGAKTSSSSGFTLTGWPRRTCMWPVSLGPSRTMYGSSTTTWIPRGSPESN